MKFLNPMSSFQPGDPTKGLGIPRETGLDYRTSRGLGETETPILEGTNKILNTPRPRGEEQWPQRRLNQNYLLVLEGLLWRCGLARAYHRCWGTQSSLGVNPLEVCHWPYHRAHWPYHRAHWLQGSDAPGQTATMERGQPCSSANNWIKALLRKALPVRARPSFSLASRGTQSLP